MYGISIIWWYVREILDERNQLIFCSLMIEAFQRPRVHLNMASIDKLSGDEVIEVCLSVLEIIENHRAHHRACFRKAMAMERGG